MMEDRTLLHNIRRGTKMSTPVLIISKLFVVALPIAQIVIGVLYLDECPAQHYIPVYLLVSGGFSVCLGLLSCLPCTQESEDNQSTISTLCTTWNSLITLFLFCWFITGNVWVYSIYQPSYVPGSAGYCSKVLYLFSFWTLTLVYVLLGLTLLLGCCVCVCVLVCGRSGQDDASDGV